MQSVDVDEDDAVVGSVLESVTDLELAGVVFSELAVVDPEILVVTVVYEYTIIIMTSAGDGLMPVINTSPNTHYFLPM